LRDQLVTGGGEMNAVIGPQAPGHTVTILALGSVAPSSPSPIIRPQVAVPITEPTRSANPRRPQSARLGPGHQLVLRTGSQKNAGANTKAIA
jgi:hypothetical protein